MKKFVIIMAGGQGKRFGESVPKQFFRESPESLNMLEKTVHRLYPLVLQEDCEMVVVAKIGQKDFLEECNLKGNIIYSFEEDVVSNTASAILGVIFNLSQRLDSEAIFAFFPVDHEISESSKLLASVKQAFRLSLAAENIFLLGTTPEEISKEFGYMLLDNPYLDTPSLSSYPIKQFIEKPSESEIQQLSQEKALQNLGIFIGRSSAFLKGFLISANTGNIETMSFDQFVIKNNIDLCVALKANFAWKDLGVRISHQPECYAVETTYLENSQQESTKIDKHEQQSTNQV